MYKTSGKTENGMVPQEEMQFRDFKTQLSDMITPKGKKQVSASEMRHFSEDYAELALDISAAPLQSGKISCIVP